MPRLNTALDSSLDGWLHNYARKHFFRVAHVMDYDDLIQEGYVAFAICRQRYKRRIKNQRHFMALCQRSFIRRITDLSRTSPQGMTPKYGYSWHTKRDDRPTLEPIEAAEFGGPSVSNLGPFQVLLHEAKFPVSAVLALYLTPHGLVLLDREKQRPNERLNTYLARLIGVPATAYDLPTMVASFLRGSGCYFVQMPQLEMP